MGVFSELEKRGLIAQMTHPEEIKRLLENEKVTFTLALILPPTAFMGHFFK